MAAGGPAEGQTEEVSNGQEAGPVSEGEQDPAAPGAGDPQWPLDAGVPTDNAGAEADEPEACIACAVPFKHGDMVLNNFDGGLLHVDCCGPERDSYVDEEGEPLKEGEPIPTGWPYVAATADPAMPEQYLPRPFVKRSVTIMAMPTDGTPESNRSAIDWTRGSETPASMDKNGEGAAQLSINTLEGALWVSPGDWILRGVKGEHYPCKPEIFASLYDEAAPLTAFETATGSTAPASTVAAEPWTIVDRAAEASSSSAVEAFWAIAAEDTRLPEDIRKNWRHAGAFVLANRDAPASSIPIELALKKLGGSMKPSPIETVLWTVFRTVFLLVHDHLDGEQKATAERLAAQAALMAAADNKRAWPGDLALTPQPGAFDPAGFSPRR